MGKGGGGGGGGERREQEKLVRKESLDAGCEVQGGVNI